jgi:sn1-specific diacylglycerol lipase
MIVAPIDGVAEKDILYANYECDVVKCPFAVVLDHKWNSVVVTIRGSTTIDDFVTDMTVDEVELTEWGKRCGFDGEGRFAHRGFLDSSAWIYDKIEKQGVLAKLSKSRLYKHYRLRIVGVSEYLNPLSFRYRCDGLYHFCRQRPLPSSHHSLSFCHSPPFILQHSLGAGVSSILALFYRSQFPTVRAVAFEPPGCTMSSNLAAESKEWTLSFVNATDVVPRYVSCFDRLKSCVKAFVKYPH